MCRSDPARSTPIRTPSTWNASWTRWRRRRLRTRSSFAGRYEGFSQASCRAQCRGREGDWGKPLPAGVHRGIAQFMGYGSYSAATAEVSVSPQGKLKVHRMVLALDCGHAVNPGQIEAQVQGSVAFGLTATLYGEMPVENGRMTNLNFDTYEIMRLAEMPKVETVIVPTYDFGVASGADHLRGGASRTQRHFCGNRKAGAQLAAQERKAGIAPPMVLCSAMSVEKLASAWLPSSGRRGMWRRRSRRVEPLARFNPAPQKSSGALSTTSFMTKKVRVWRTPGSAINWSPWMRLKSSTSPARIFRK